MQWRTLLAAMLGWILDAMDVMLYSFALVSIQQEFSLSGAQSGLLTTAMLFSAALGGTLAGYLADRIGRTRVLMGSILTYSLFTAAIATASSFEQLLFWRVLVGFGLGAEWSAGTVLVAESWPSKHRGKAIAITQSGWAIGYILASLLAAAILPTYGWRPLFAVGILPALLTLWIRRAVPEPKVWSASAPRQPIGILFRPPLFRYVVVDKHGELDLVRLLGVVHVGTGVSGLADREGWGRSQRRPVDWLHHPYAVGGIGRLSEFRVSVGSIWPPPSVRRVLDGRCCRDLFIWRAGAESRVATGAGSVGGVLWAWVLQRLRGYSE